MKDKQPHAIEPSILITEFIYIIIHNSTIKD